MKTYISDSLISEALIVMQAMKQNGCFSVPQVESIKTYYGINKKAALVLATQCNWITLRNESTYEMTSYGEKLLQHFNGTQVSTAMYRDILRNYILICKPIWARKIPFGRNVAFQIMSDEEQICFKKAGLMNNPVTRDEVDWWDDLAKKIRQEIEHQNDDTGRRGEELTIRYEKERTKAEPIWESVNSNFAGYDILSQVSDSDTHQVLIEVKSSTQSMNSATFFISHNEWSIASAGCNQRRYYFYLWLLDENPELAIVSYADMLKHIPQDNGLGEWNDVNVPFAAFSNEFHPIEL